MSNGQSFSLGIRDVFFNALAADPFFATFTKRKTTALPVMDAHLPCLGVYLVDETMVPDGHYNAAEVRFIHHARIGFSVIVRNNDPDAAETALDTSWGRIMNDLWPNISKLLVNGYQIEGVIRGTRRHLFGSAGRDNETPIAELRYEATCVTRDAFPPPITDDFDSVYVDTPLRGPDELPPIVTHMDMTAPPAPDPTDPNYDPNIDAKPKPPPILIVTPADDKGE
jgi:hypothetical protein